MTKKCFKCGKAKPLVDFYKHPMMADGHLGKCKECTKSDVRENYYKNHSYYCHYDIKRSKGKDRRAKMKLYQRTMRANHPEKTRAYNAVHRAIKKGQLERKPCEVCGNPKTHAHHEDYSKPLDVVFLCFKHHWIRHGKVVELLK